LKDCGCLNPDFSLDLPNICLVGPQESGKSSLIESLIGFDCLPIDFDKNKTVCTKRPIELKMVNVPNTSYFEFKSEEPYKGNKFDISDLKSKLSEIMSKEEKIRNEPIKIIISSDRGIDMTIIDLPGYDEQNKITKEIIFNYAKHESNLMIFVKNANSEKFVEEMTTVKNNKLVKLLEEVDKEFSRTIGVITKADLIFQQGTHHSSSNFANNETLNLIKKLLSKETNQDHPFSFILVKNRADSNTKLEDNQYKEKEYINTHMRSLTSTQFTVDSLADKLKNMIFAHTDVKKNLVLLNKTLKEKMAEVQKSLLQYGTEYIQYTNDTKNTYVTSLLNTFSESIEKIFAGKMQESSDNLASHELKKIYNDFLLKKNKYTPGSTIKNEDIIKIIRLTEGDRLSGFPESEVIYSLLDEEIELLRNEVKSYLDSINEISRETIKNQLQRIFCRFPRLNERVEELMNVFLDQVSKKIIYILLIL
jgi:GTP-binding protein EngB required for normal cell division